jgi:hypothetical protein
MGSPGYKYSPWTPERRKAASERAKRRWEERRAREAAERVQERYGVSGQLRSIRYSKATEMKEVAARWHRLKSEVEEIDETLTLLDKIRPVLRKYRVGQQ